MGINGLFVRQEAREHRNAGYPRLKFSPNPNAESECHHFLSTCHIMSVITPDTSHFATRQLGAKCFPSLDSLLVKLLFFPACEQTGLHHVHPTWAGTFALAALVALFPGTNFILLDSDYLPVTLFEAADLWREGYLTRFPPRTGKTLPTKHPLHRKQAYLHDPKVVYTQQKVNKSTIGQGVL